MACSHEEREIDLVSICEPLLLLTCFQSSFGCVLTSNPAILVQIMVWNAYLQQINQLWETESTPSFYPKVFYSSDKSASPYGVQELIK